MTRPVHILTGPRETPDQMLAKLGNVLFELEDNYRSVIEYGALFTALTATEEMEGDVALGMNRLAWRIIDHGKAIEAAHGEMTGIVRRLRNP
jgi:hypothetical protein